MHFDIFNGDADGICALIQLRLHRPQQSILITGVKRDIQLLNKLTVSKDDQLVVLDISLEKNQSQMRNFLSLGAHIFYIDHHQSVEIHHPHLNTLIDTDPNICTSLLVNRYLEGKYPLWAIVGAFGDNLQHAAEKMATSLLSSAKVQQLNKLGMYINYNSYGESISDLNFEPERLYREMTFYQSPFEFIVEKKFIYSQLECGYHDDLNKEKNIKSIFEGKFVKVFMLPDTAWARRVSGVFGNYLVNKYSNAAIAILSHRQDKDYQVSIRAPLTNKAGADIFCAQFSTGGGRKAAAGINHLPEDKVTLFIQQLEAFYSILR